MSKKKDVDRYLFAVVSEDENRTYLTVRIAQTAEEAKFIGAKSFKSKKDSISLMKSDITMEMKLTINQVLNDYQNYEFDNDFIVKKLEE